tara:strand:+ start:440 stop:1000 length:561 start_codon:yes stop_codon:yes gene_type:complete
MKLFEMDKLWNLTVSEEAWGLSAFNNILKRDRTKDKSRAMKDMLFIYYYCDIKSNYISMTHDVKLSELKKDLNLAPKWEVDELIEEGLELYNKLSRSVIQQLYEDTLISAQAIGTYLRNTEELLAERDVQGKPVYDITKITNANEKVPKLMANLKAAYKEVVKEKEDNENKTKGSKKFNMFEDGLL